jgi:hypothetical protein
VWRKTTFRFPLAKGLEILNDYWPHRFLQPYCIDNARSMEMMPRPLFYPGFHQMSSHKQGARDAEGFARTHLNMMMTAVNSSTCFSANRVRATAQLPAWLIEKAQSNP